MWSKDALYEDPIFKAFSSLVDRVHDEWLNGPDVPKSVEEAIPSLAVAIRDLMSNTVAVHAKASPPPPLPPPGTSISHQAPIPSCPTSLTRAHIPKWVGCRWRRNSKS